MSTKVLIKKVATLEKRIDLLEKRLSFKFLERKQKTTPNKKEALNSLYNVWKKDPRTQKQLRTVRKRLWNE